MESFSDAVNNTEVKTKMFVNGILFNECKNRPLKTGLKFKFSMAILHKINALSMTIDLYPVVILSDKMPPSFGLNDLKIPKFITTNIC